MSLVESYKEIRARLRNPPNGRVSDERTEIVSDEKHRQRRMEQLKQAAEADRAARLKRQIADIADRLMREAGERALEKERREREERERGILSMATIQKVICAWFGVNHVSLISERRTHDVIYPRHIAMYLCRHHTTATLAKIGRHFGGRDHTTALHSINKISALLESGQAEVVEDVVRLRRALGVEGK